MRIPLTFEFDHNKVIGFIEIKDEYMKEPDIGSKIIAPALGGKAGEKMEVVCYGLIHINKALEPNK